MPAMPGRVNVAPSSDSDAEHQAQVEDQRDVGEHAEQPVEQHHEDDDQHDPDDAGDRAGMDRIGAELGPDRALLEDRDRRRQGAGAQQQCQVARRLHREAAGDDAAAAEDRLADHRRADHLVVEHDRKRLADILAGRVAEAAWRRRRRT